MTVLRFIQSVPVRQVIYLGSSREIKKLHSLHYPLLIWSYVLVGVNFQIMKETTYPRDISDKQNCENLGHSHSHLTSHQHTFLELFPLGQLHLQSSPIRPSSDRSGARGSGGGDGGTDGPLIDCRLQGVTAPRCLLARRWELLFVH